jgi:uncharacterized protein
MADFLPTQTTPASDPNFVGRGFSWPLSVDHTGSIRLTAGVPDLDQSMRLVLMTAPGERVMRPEFGCRIWDLLFEPITANLLGLINEAVRRALAQWEPRVEVREVTSSPAEEDGLVRVMIDYTVRSTNDRRNLVFPFYVIPHDSE